LVSIMSQNIDKGIIDEVGTNYSEESDTEWWLYEEGFTFPQRWIFFR
jgi:hypothetical protein